MRAPLLFVTGLLAFCLGGCLVSETPILTAANGIDTPLAPGDYDACSIERIGEDADCTQITASINEHGLYRIDADGDMPTLMRMHSIGHRGYVVQVRESEDEHAYYFGDARGAEFKMTFMMCQELPEGLRAELLQNGDLETEDDEQSICIVKSLRGLRRAAQAYFHGDAPLNDEGEQFTIFYRPRSGPAG